MREDCQHVVTPGQHTLRKGYSSNHLGLQLNKVKLPPLSLTLQLFFSIFYGWQKLRQWIHGKNTSSKYWDVSKVKRIKTVSQQLPSFFPLDIWNVASFSALICAQSTGEAPQVTRAGSLDCRARLSERDRCVIEDSQPWPAGMPDSLGGYDKQLPDPRMRTHTHTHTEPPVFMLIIIFLGKVSFSAWELSEGTSILFAFVGFNLHYLEWSIQWGDCRFAFFLKVKTIWQLFMFFLFLFLFLFSN